jgi:hypothetical protein
MCFVGIIVASNLSTISWTSASKWLWQALQLMVLLFTMELVVDWAKHAFITKFNRIRLDVYQQFATVLRVDLAATRVAGLQATLPWPNRDSPIPSTEIVSALLEQSHNVCRRLGFVPMPLACIVSLLMQSDAAMSSKRVMFRLSAARFAQLAPASSQSSRSFRCSLDSSYSCV